MRAQVQPLPVGSWDCGQSRLAEHNCKPKAAPLFATNLPLFSTKVAESGRKWQNSGKLVVFSGRARRRNRRLLAR